jgi:hypothetical protein
MTIARAMPKVLRAISILLLGPLVGILIAFALALAVFSLRTDPNIAVSGGHATPGDGILILLFGLISLCVSIPLSIWGAVAVWSRPSATTKLHEPNSAQPDVVS